MASRRLLMAICPICSRPVRHPVAAPTPGTILFGSRVADAGGFGERHVINTVLTGSTAPAGIQDFNIFASSTGVSASRAFTKPLGGVASTSPNMSTSMEIRAAIGCIA